MESLITNKKIKEKVLLLDIYQPFAHYREPKVMQDDYIPTLNLPPATTIAGMISYLIDRKIKTKFKIGVVGSHKKKNIEFIRGEHGDFMSKYEILLKDKSRKIDLEKYYEYHKKKSKNRIMYFEILEDVELKIFISTDDNELIKSALEKPGKYLSLGRKEDFIFPANRGKKFVEEVEIDTVFIGEKKQAIKEEILFKNTYIPVNIREKESMNIMQEGILYSLPKRYRDLNAEKEDRIMEYANYVYVDEKGCYLKNINANVYSYLNSEGNEEKLVFTWLTEER